MNEENKVTGNGAEPTSTVQRKSIVPAKYGQKYKKGGTDDLAKFINAQCIDGGEFKWDKFWQLCRINGLDETKVAMYEQQVADKRHGAPGRARMTLRNMLATPARTTGKLKGLDGEEHALHVPPAITPASAASTSGSVSAGGEAPNA